MDARREAIHPIGTVHAHSHAGHAARSRDDQRRLLVALALAASYMGAEAVGGWLTGSLALLADAGHMLSDVFALSLSVFALRIAQRPPTPQRTYGYYRTEILAALVHGVLLVVVSLFIFLEAWERWGAPPEILGAPMFAVATGGLAVNLLGLWVLRSGAHHSLNVRGAWLHVLSDTLGSLGAMGAGLAVWAFGWTWADPLVSVGIALLIIHSSWALIGEALHVLMEGAPAHVDVESVRRAIGRIPGVQEVHDLHVWTITSGLVSLSGHVVAEPGASHRRLLGDVHDLAARFHIGHTTIQIEPEDFEDAGSVCPPGEDTGGVASGGARGL